MLSRPGVRRAPRSAGLLQSFRHALRGVVEVAARERNMKLHLCAGTTVGVLGSEVAFLPGARLALLLCVALVLAGEALNSALEALVDLHTQELRHEARRVKDAAAGAVLLLAAGAVLTGTVVLGASWRELCETWARGHGRAALDAAAVACVAALLFAPMRRPLAIAVAAAGAGALLLVAAGSVSLPFTGLAAGLLAVAAAARLRPPPPAPSADGGDRSRGAGERPR